MEASRFDSGQTPEHINRADKGLSDQFFFYADEQEEYTLLEQARIANGFPIKPLSQRTQDELDYRGGWGFWPEDEPEWMEEWLKDPDEVDDTAIQDEYWGS